MSIVLTIDEMKAASGAARPSGAIRWFRENGFTFKVGVDGWPRVDRQHWHKVMGGDTRERSRTEPTLNLRV